ncbi:MAG: hypothetical protein ACYCXF_06650 [Thermoleophilia bacterium]
MSSYANNIRLPLEEPQWLVGKKAGILRKTKAGEARKLEGINLRVLKLAVQLSGFATAVKLEET